MDISESIGNKIRKELKYYRIQNIRLLQEVEELRDVVSHNRSRYVKLNSDRQDSEELVNFLRGVVSGDGS